MTRPSSRRAVAAGATLALAAGAAALVAAPAASAAVAKPRIVWSGPCSYDDSIECGTIRVPLDYDHPGGKTITLAVDRHKATDTAHKLGSLFVNPGGPGGSGLGLSAFAEFLVGPKAAARYDVVGFDPRGIGASAGVQCFKSNAAFEANYGHAVDVPVSRGEIADVLAAARHQSAACGRNAGPVLKHMSTLDVVRDLDRMRQAVGDPKLQYLGYSYGTMIGATYAAVYPKKVGRLVNDGPVDPDNRANHRVANKRVRAEGFEHALDGFLASCKTAGSACAFAAGDRTPRQKYVAMRTLLRKGPVRLSDTSQVTLSNLVDTTASAMYQRSQFIPLAKTLQDLYEAIYGPSTARLSAKSLKALKRGHAGPSQDVRPGVRTRAAGGDAYQYNGVDSFFGVNCVDAPLPRDPSKYAGYATSYEKTAPTFGRSEAFSEVACATWPVITKERFAGPWNAKSAYTVLVVGQTYDPATPYPMAKNMTAELGNARLLTVDGFGHTSQDSACALQAEGDYFLTGKLPAKGARCAQDLGPFDS